MQRFSIFLIILTTLFADKIQAQVNPHCRSFFQFVKKAASFVKITYQKLSLLGDCPVGGRGNKISLKAHEATVGCSPPR